MASDAAPDTPLGVPTVHSGCVGTCNGTSATAKNGVPTVHSGCVGTRLAASATENNEKTCEEGALLGVVGFVFIAAARVDFDDLITVGQFAHDLNAHFRRDAVHDAAKRDHHA